VVQDLILRPHVIRYRRERWLTPAGETVVAPVPAGTVGRFGPALRRFVLTQYHRGQVTIPRLVAQLRDLGVDISKRQVVRLLTAGPDAFLGLMKPCDKLDLSFWDYLGNRLLVPDAPLILPLPDLVRQRAAQ
jgi:hypothetical protein